MSKAAKRSCSLVAALAIGAALIASPAEAKNQGDHCHHHNHHHHQKTITFEGDFLFVGAHLSFQGSSIAPRRGFDTIDGDTDFMPGSSPVCFAIVADFVVLTAFDGSELYIENSGEDCLDFSTGAPVFVGTGTSQILGGTGRFHDADGDGTYSVAAAAATLTPEGAEGTFTLTFNLDIDD